VGECRAECDALLFASRQLGRVPVAFRREADALEQLVGAIEPVGARRAAQTQLERDQLAGTQLGRERARVMLVGVAEAVER
jgi:hypothetical protein